VRTRTDRQGDDSTGDENVTQLDRIEALLQVLVQQSPKDYYSTEEFAACVGLTAYTVREHCRRGRLKAAKKQSGRGKFASWTLEHAELLRFQREGLLRTCTCATSGPRNRIEVTP
jgi:hypothetical protein